MAGHQVDCHLGEDSPLGKLYDADASVLLLGVGYESCTALHLGEYRYTRYPPRQTYSCVVLGANGERRWMTYPDVVLDDSEFEVIGNSLDRDIGLSRTCVGYAESRLVRFREVVDYATDWLRTHRK
jgi:aminoglycoside 3-N-acetyltransferase